MRNTTTKVIALLLVSALFLAGTGTGLAQGTSLPDMLTYAEMAVYGAAEPGALLDRVVRLEKDVYGREGTGALLSRVQGIYNYVTSGLGGASSIVLQLNVVEYIVFEQMSSEKALAERLDELERNILGATQDLPIVERVRGLVRTVWAGDELNVKAVRLPAETLVKITLLTDIDSAKSKVGEIVRYRVVQDVKVDDRIVIPAGVEGQGRVASVQSAARFGQGGRVGIEWGAVTSFDRTSIRLDVSERAARHTEELAVAASMAGVIILANPIGLVGGLLVQGKEHVVPAGTELFIAVARDTHVQGLSLMPVR